ncbi:hypothetical protein ACFFV7_36010 [Nonomuraea spiralis]|uniref:Spore-associated protein A n=1 Tax=Nonomuraea spiralis TaxID=46182 RepID=A0ABV5IQ21_9ACTN|nr:hypothetical protein [Nonomuraea spiralis]GGT11459.1 hypothetical protein GCM10010176_065170 [Nonomuraea spiralis]
MRRPAKAILLTAAIAFSGVLAAPADATAASSPQSICGSGFGLVSDGTRPVKTKGGQRYGTVYLLYNGGTGENCVVTVKSSFVGTKTTAGASIIVMPKARKDEKQNPIVRSDIGKFSQYAGPVKYWAKGSCVRYWGMIESPGGVTATGGRDAWGNCG